MRPPRTWTEKAQYAGPIRLGICAVFAVFCIDYVQARYARTIDDFVVKAAVPDIANNRKPRALMEQEAAT